MLRQPQLGGHGLLDFLVIPGILYLALHLLLRQPFVRFDYLLALTVRLGKHLVLFPDGVEILVAQRELLLKFGDVLRIREDEGYRGLLGIRVSLVLLRFDRRRVTNED